MGWGVYGAGLATTMAQIVSCTFLCSRMLSSGILKVEDLKVPPSAAAVMPMLRVGGILTLRNIISFGESGGSTESHTHGCQFGHLFR